jgi:hypothetical protein|tara:strand:- start:324 stop:479 length:156 start_codon:yes stop_codon:yes gene_type:complete
MKEWYEFNKEAIQAIKENPKEAIQCIAFLAILFGSLWGLLWFQAIVSGQYV